MGKYLAAYLRLSVEDDGDGESNSIAAQRQLVKDFVSSKPELSGIPCREFADDGYSGTNFDRPAMTELVRKIKRGEISCVVVKDLSRFGRQFLEVSKYIEQFFPAHGVRFVAINDGYDSADYEGAIDLPIRNMINAFYSRDISKKVKSAKRVKIQQGVFASAQAIYGYAKTPCNKHELVIDEPAAAVVRRIFRLSEEGASPYQIANILNEEKVTPPSAYKKQNGVKRGWNTVDDKAVLWTKAAVLRLIRDERYTGVFVGGMWETDGPGGKRRRLSPDEWVRVPNAHPAIVSARQFEAVGGRGSFGGTRASAYRPLSKKVRCGWCGHLLRYRGDAATPYYYCDTARYTSRHGCGLGRTIESELVAAVSELARVQAMLVLEKRHLAKGPSPRFARFEAGGLPTQRRLVYEQIMAGEIDRRLVDALVDTVYVYDSGHISVRFNYECVFATAVGGSVNEVRDRLGQER